MEKLKTCPFCGANANGPTDAWPHMIVCEGCGASVKGLGFAEDGMREAVRKWNRREAETPPQERWISVKDGLPLEHDTIFARFYGTDKWKSNMFQKMSEDVRVVKMLRDGTRRVHHDYTVDGTWECERKSDIYGRVTHWMLNPELPEVDHGTEHQD